MREMFSAWIVHPLTGRLCVSIIGSFFDNTLYNTWANE